MSTDQNSQTVSEISKLAAEYIGTFTLVLIGCGSAVIAGTQIGFLGISLAFGLTLTVIAYTFGGISGGHFNPAVTLGQFINGGISGINAIKYVTAQILGALAGSTVLYCINPKEFGHNFVHKGYNTLSAVIGELVFTSLFLIVILGSTSKSGNSKHAPLAIGFFLTLAHLVLIPVTGTSLNPARSIAPAVFAQGQALNELWIFVFIPLIGATIGALTWKYLLNPEKS